MNIEDRHKYTQARLQAIVESAVDDIIRDFNPAAEKLFGYRADEVIGRNIGFLMPEPYRSQHDQYIKNHLATDEKLCEQVCSG